MNWNVLNVTMLQSYIVTLSNHLNGTMGRGTVGRFAKNKEELRARNLAVSKISCTFAPL